MLTRFKRGADAPAETVAAVVPAPDAGAIVAALSQQASTLRREAAEVRGVIDDTHKAAAT